jgi:hypothetical protein
MAYGNLLRCWLTSNIDSSPNNQNKGIGSLDAGPKPATCRLAACLVAVLIIIAAQALAGPSIAPGDLALRHDIQRLADYGVIAGPVTTWPLAWGPILADIRNFEPTDKLPPAVTAAIARVRDRGLWETSTNEWRYRARAAAAEEPARIRSFQSTPREEGEISAGISWTGERFSVDVNASAVSNPSDDKDVRADGSKIAMAIGNFTLAASTMDRWWGPGWDGSQILSNNPRPIPALTIDRNRTDAFKTKWLRWLGPWDMSFIWGQMEDGRAIPNAKFLGLRVNFRPLPSLEIGLSRSAQWCGDGRPCDFDTFIDLLLGKDNRGDAGTTPENEPGNQLAGIDFRWAMTPLKLPLAMYGQFIGEDEAGGFPSRYIGQLGIEGTGSFGGRWSYRWYGEASMTTCEFYQSPERFNCAYNHFVYATGYRYRARAIGHAADNDAAVATAGLVLVDDAETSWQGLVRYGRLNRGGSPDSANSLTPVRQDVLNVELIHNRIFRFGRIEFGLGYQQFDGNAAISSSNDASAFIQWRSDY